ncbi:hypothetical protein RRG08_007835 [Elysia crispata]|uniref:Uncharacterized protein n=1 Tax=Elysia crispata TaxID=231223 RepID=A0AAE0XWV6_9GAST|nr:hypothetical protein RRG08_007835 [Elysia crispata]
MKSFTKILKPTLRHITSASNRLTDRLSSRPHGHSPKPFYRTLEFGYLVPFISRRNAKTSILVAEVPAMTTLSSRLSLSFYSDLQTVNIGFLWSAAVEFDSLDGRVYDTLV